MSSSIGIFHFLVLGIILFVIGFFGVVISEKPIKILLSIGVIFGSVCINFVAVSKYCDGLKTEGNTFVIFIILVFLIHIIIFSSLIYNMYKKAKQRTD